MSNGIEFLENGQPFRFPRQHIAVFSVRISSILDVVLCTRCITQYDKTKLKKVFEYFI